MELHVFREWRETFQHVGSMSFSDGDMSFAYDPTYLNARDSSAISLTLPLRDGPFGQQETSPFFAGLSPEGTMKKLVAESIHSNSFSDMLVRLNLESIGGLVFSVDRELESWGCYEPLGKDALVRLRDEPRAGAFEMCMASRLSLSGAQSKVGLYHVGEDPAEGWFLPKGVAGTTHIIKTPEPIFPNQTVNEALCLETARRCGFDVADWMLIPLPGGEPLIAIKRFDRRVECTDSSNEAIARPRRLHQEDFCQATGLMPDFKYEPTGTSYIARVCKTILRASSNPFGDRMLFLQSVFFDYLVGNCDNHLKNYSLLWDAAWQSRELAPRYDIVCTTIYPSIYLEMGISLCPSRRITDVSEGDIDAASRAAGVPVSMGRRLYQEIYEDIPSALDEAEALLCEEGFASASHIAEHIRRELKEKVRL